MGFIKDMIWQPATFVWAIITGGVSLAAFFGIGDNASTQIKSLVIISTVLLLLLIGIYIKASSLYQRSKTPAKIRTIVEGDHFYHGTVVIILDKSNWVEADQILTLVQSADGVQTPLALLRVETFTTEKFPRCVLLTPLTNEDLNIYLSDKTRWKSMSALSDVKARYLEGATNA